MRIVTEPAGEKQGGEALQLLGVNFINDTSLKVVNLSNSDGSSGFPMLSNTDQHPESTLKFNSLNLTPEQRVVNLIQILDGGTEIKKNKRRNNLAENVAYSKKLRIDIIPHITKELGLSILKLIKFANNEKLVHQAGSHTRKAILHTDDIDVIDEKHMAEIRSILELVKNLHEKLPNILYIAPYYLELQQEAKRFSEILLLFDFWQEFPEYIGSLMPSKDVARFPKKAQDSVAIHYRHLLVDMSLWYGELTLDLKGNGQSSNQSLKRQLQKHSKGSLPHSFPFIGKFGKVKSDEAVAYFEQILFLPLWSGKYLLGQNADRINPTLIAFFQKHKIYLLPYLQNETNVLTDTLVDIFGAEKVREYITKYCLVTETIETPSAQKKRMSPRPKLPTVEHASVQRISVQMEGMFLRMVPPIPDGWMIEAKIGKEGLWKQVHEGYIDALAENIYSEQEVCFRIARNEGASIDHEGGIGRPPVLISNMIKYRSPELTYLMKSAPSLRNEFIIRQVFLEGKKSQAQELINYWTYPMSLLLWISVDEGKTWKSYQNEEYIEVTDFAGGEIQFAYSPEGEGPLSGVKITKLTLQKKVTDIVGGTTSKVHVGLTREPPLQETNIHAPLKSDEERALELYESLEAKRYILDNTETGDIQLIFTGESDKQYSVLYSPKSGKLTGFPEDSILKGLFVLAQGELKTVFQQKIAEEEKKLDDAFNAKLRPAEYYLQILGAFLLKFSSIDTIIGNSAIFSVLRNDSGFLGVGNFFNGKKEILEGFQNSLSEAGLIIDIKRTRLGNTHDENPRGTEMSLTLSLPGTSGIQGTISSTSTGNKYAIVCDESMSPVSKKRFENLLINALILLGVIGKYNPDESHAKKVTIQDISGVVSGKAMKLPQGILKDEKSQILETYKRFKTGEGKICEEFGFSHELGCYMNIIHSRQGLESIEGKVHNNFVVLVDEKFSSVKEGRSGQVEVYNLLQHNPRMQKYLALRIRETLLGDDYKGKSALTGTMLDEFLNYWDSLAPSVRVSFLEAVQSSTDEALRVNEGNDTHTSVISGLIEYWRTKKVQIIYSRPQLMPVDEFLSRVEMLKGKK